MSLHLIEVIFRCRLKLIVTTKHAILSKPCFAVYISCLILLGSRPQKTRMWTFSKKEYGQMALNCSVLGKTLYTANTMQYISYVTDKNHSQYDVIGSDINSHTLLKHTKHTVCNWAYLSLFIPTFHTRPSQVRYTAKIAQSRLIIIHFPVVESFWNFTQSTALWMPCFLQNYKMIWNLKDIFWAKQIVWDFNLRLVVNGLALLWRSDST